MNLLNPNLPPHTVPANKLKALIFDWAGTTVDFGSLAPARTLAQLFSSMGISLSDAEIRRDMGLAKKLHIQSILSILRVRQAWQSLRGRQPTEKDVEEIYQRFIALQFSCLAEYSALIPGVVESVQRCRARGLKIGSTTGYPRPMLNLLLRNCAKAGYQPDCSLCPDDVGSSRPSPFMIYENAVRLQVSPLAAIAKIGDTPADIHEGLNAGAWSIGVAATGNAIGLSLAALQALSEDVRRARVAQARAELQQAGAHYVIDTLDDLQAVLDDIDSRLQSAHSQHSFSS